MNAEQNKNEFYICFPRFIVMVRFIRTVYSVRTNWMNFFYGQ